MLKIDVTKKYALAVSGGMDSMVMLHAFANHLPRLDFFVATINHNIRAEGKSDCQFVESYCRQLGVDCKIFDVDVPTHATQNKLSLETSARILRYQVLDSLDCDYVCLAHHQKDNVETILMHILRGSGANGAMGMQKYNGKYFRPLLDCPKEQIYAHATQNKIPFVIDVTNDDNTYTRNALRNKVLPVLEQICPSFEQNILRFSQNVSMDEELLQSMVDTSQVTFLQDKATLPLSLFNAPQPLVYRLLKKVFDNLGYNHDIESCHYQAICEIANNVGGKQVNLPFGLVAINDYTHVTICLQQDKTNDAVWQIPFATGTTQTPVGTVDVSATPMENALCFDVTQIPSSAVFRTRQSGDLFKKFGGGTKPLKDYLIDKKIPQRQRDDLLLLADGKDILIVVGVEIADQIKVTNSKNAHYIKLQ